MKLSLVFFRKILKHGSRPFLVLLVVIFGGDVGAEKVSSGPSVQKKAVQSTTHTVPAKGVVALYVRGHHGRISFSRHDAEDITVKVASKDPESAKNITIKKSEDGKYVSINEKMFGKKADCPYTIYEILLPKKAEMIVDVRFSKLSLRLQEVSVDLRVSGGTVVVTDTPQTLVQAARIQAGRAKIRLGSVQGDLTLVCAQGHVKVSCQRTTPAKASRRRIAITQGAGSCVLGLPEGSRVRCLHHWQPHWDFLRCKENFDTDLLCFLSPNVTMKVKKNSDSVKRDWGAPDNDENNVESADFLPAVSGRPDPG